MAVESSANYISDLNINWPDGAVDPKSDGDNHLRLLKRTIKATFPSLTGAVNATQGNLNALAGLSSSVTSTQLNFLTGLTANVQTSLDNKASLSGATFTGIVSAKLASGASPVFRSYNETFGGVSLGVDASGNMTLGQISSVAAYEKPWITGTRSGDVFLFGNGTLRLNTNGFGIVVTGALSTTSSVSIGDALTVTNDAAIYGDMNALGNVVASLGNVSDSRGQLKSFRTDDTLNLNGTSTAFSGIPTDAVMIKIVFADASFTGAQDLALLVANTTSYNGKTVGSDVGGNTFGVLWNAASRVAITNAMAASHKMGGAITLTKINDQSWIVESLVGAWASTNGGYGIATGSVVVSSFPGTLTITSVSGAGVFDSGFATMYVYR
jgi:hypothetical protein